MVSVGEENISQEFVLKNTDKEKKYFFEEIEQNELMSKKQKKGSVTLNYIKNLLTFALLDPFQFLLFLL